MLCSAGWISVHNDYMHLADYTRAHARVEDMDRRRVNFRTCTKIYANASTPTSSPLATTTSANDLHYIELNYNDPNNYAKLYDNAKIYVEFYVANDIAKVYINMIFIDILVNTAVAAYDTKTPPPPQNRCHRRATTKNPPPPQTRCRRRTTTKPAAVAEPLPPPRYDKNPPPPRTT